MLEHVHVQCMASYWWVKHAEPWLLSLGSSFVCCLLFKAGCKYATRERAGESQIVFPLHGSYMWAYCCERLVLCWSFQADDGFLLNQTRCPVLFVRWKLHGMLLFSEEISVTFLLDTNIQCQKY
jgi:hypothetical protein